MPFEAPIPVTVLTGFLGAGKTTLLNRILTGQHGRRLAVIENEFGEVGVDHQLVISGEEEIFEKFERGDKESATPGVGLGLAICRAILQAHGGTIRAENRPGGGARFLFELPQGPAPQIDDADIETEPAVAAARKP